MICSHSDTATRSAAPAVVISDAYLPTTAQIASRLRAFGGRSCPGAARRYEFASAEAREWALAQVRYAYGRTCAKPAD